MEKKMTCSAGLFFVIVMIVKAVAKGEDFSISAAPEKIPIHHAIKTLEDVIEEEQKILDFCRKHYDCSVVNKPLIKEKGNDDETMASDCADLFNAGIKMSGVYKINWKTDFGPDFHIKVYCDMKTEGGGWTVFQRRGEFRKPQLNFTRSWLDYASGFGNLSEEFWLGNRNIHKLTNQSTYVLRVELKDFDGNFRFANYKTLKVDSEDERFKITIGEYSGDAGDGLKDHNGSVFATYDKDDSRSCSSKYKGGWWFGGCHHSNLNGEYLRGVHDKHARGVSWHYWLGYKYSLKWTEMKVRPVNFFIADKE